MALAHPGFVQKVMEKVMLPSWHGFLIKNPLDKAAQKL